MERMVEYLLMNEDELRVVRGKIEEKYRLSTRADREVVLDSEGRYVGEFVDSCSGSVIRFLKTKDRSLQDLVDGIVFEDTPTGNPTR